MFIEFEDYTGNRRLINMDNVVFIKPVCEGLRSAIYYKDFRDRPFEIDLDYEKVKELLNGKGYYK